MTLSSRDLHRVGEILALAARTDIMPRFRKLTAAEIRQKTSAFDVVTDADEAAEATITAALEAALAPSSLARRGRTATPACCNRSRRPSWPS